MVIFTFTAQMINQLKTHCQLSLGDYVLMFGVAYLSVVNCTSYRFTRIVFLFKAAAGEQNYYIFTIQDIILLEEENIVGFISYAGMCFV